MLIKKLAVPFVNDKLLMQAEHCYIATAAITSAGFDFVRTRLPSKTKIELLTGLDSLTSPEVLRRIVRNYSDRIYCKIYNRNTFHANIYIFDLPFRKSVAFLGSGTLSLEGLKDHEEIFFKVTDPKEIESLKSWFVGYYEFAEPLTEEIVNEYEIRYPEWKHYEITTRAEKRDFVELTMKGFSWDAIKFRNQFFKKEDYLALETAKASLANPLISEEREKVASKMALLKEQLDGYFRKFKLSADAGQLAKQTDITNQNYTKITELGISYSPDASAISKFPSGTRISDFLCFQILLRQKELEISLNAGSRSGRNDRERLKEEIVKPDFALSLFKAFVLMGEGYFIEVAGERKPVTSFQNETILSQFIILDDWRYYTFKLGKVFFPGSIDVSSDKIVATLESEFAKLIALNLHTRIG
jgi:hypothetical protein